MADIQRFMYPTELQDTFSPMRRGADAAAAGTDAGKTDKKQTKAKATHMPPPRPAA